MKTKQKKYVCMICGARFVNGKGFTEQHYSPCANARYGWAWTKPVPIDWRRPTQEMSLAGLKLINASPVL